MVEARSSRRTPNRRLRHGTCAVLLGAFALVAGTDGTQTVQANGDTRSLTLYHTHRGDSTTVTFKRDGRYDSEGLRQLSYFLRDWRNNKQTRMEPRLFDIVWEVHRAVGRGGTINVVSSYRSPETNALLRARSSGVAKFSQHMLGRAMDFYITGVPVSAVREAGIRLQRGGVGFYPTSGRPFVHLDAGNVRAWPRMTRSQLARLFPGGKTVHQPAEGGQMPGYQVAAAELRANGGGSLDAAYGRPSSSSGKGFFARLFGGGADEAGDEAETQIAAAPARGPASSSRAAGDEGGAAAPTPVKVATVRVPVPPARPADMVRTVPAAEPTLVAAASVPMPPVAPARPAGAPAETQVAQANVPLPPVAPIAPGAAAQIAQAAAPLPPIAPDAPGAPVVVASRSSVPVPMPRGDAIAVASAGSASGGEQLAWRIGAQPAGAGTSAAPALELASTIPTPRPRPTTGSAVAVLAALPTPGPDRGAASKPREIDAEEARAYQAEAATFPRLPDAFLGRKSAGAEEIALAYAPQAAELPSAARAKPRAAVAPQTRVTASVPLDPSVKVLSPDSTPAAVYAAATAPLRLRATLDGSQPLITPKLEGAALAAAVSPVAADHSGEMLHPDQSRVSSLMAAPNAALVGGFGSDPTHGARSDRFAGSSVMLLRTQSFLPTSTASASGGVRLRG